MVPVDADNSIAAICKGIPHSRHIARSTQLSAIGIVTLNERFNLPHIPELIARKQSEREETALQPVERSFHQQEYERLCQLLEEASDRSHLPESSTAKDRLDDLLVRIRLGQTSTAKS